MGHQISDPPTVKILIVDDHAAVRDGLATRVAQQNDMMICGEAEDMENAFKLATEIEPDLIIVDISLKDGDGLSLVKKLKAQNENVRILVWSMHCSSLYAAPSIRAGAHGYVNKWKADDILDAIREVMAGRTYTSAPAVN